MLGRMLIFYQVKDINWTKRKILSLKQNSSSFVSQFPAHFQYNTHHIYKFSKFICLMILFLQQNFFQSKN